MMLAAGNGSDGTATRASSMCCGPRAWEARPCCWLHSVPVLSLHGCCSACWAALGDCVWHRTCGSACYAKARMADIASCEPIGKRISGAGWGSSSCRRSPSRSWHCRFSRWPVNRHLALPWLAVGILIWLLAVLGETIADEQLARFRADPAHRGRTCRIGLWRYSRHPNYFCEWLHWFAYVALAAGSPLWGLSWVGPLADVRLPPLPQRHSLGRGAGATDPGRGLPPVSAHARRCCFPGFPSARPMSRRCDERHRARSP